MSNDPQKMLSPKRRKLLGLLLKENPGRKISEQGTRSRKVIYTSPLSFAQERLWFLDQLMPGSVFYSVPVTIDIAGQLDIEAFEASLQKIVERHETLRTTFSVMNGQPMQVIVPSLSIQLPFIDLRGLVTEEQKEELQRLMQEEIARSFDLSNGSLLRVALLRLAEQKHVMLLNMHHIVCDGWSLEIFRQELVSLYNAFSRHQLFSLPELEIQYADFALWQRRYLQGTAFEEDLAYWRNQMAGSFPHLELPFSQPRPSGAILRAEMESFILSGEILTKLKALAQKEGVTLYTILVAVFKVLLQRYTDQQEIVIGSVIAGRSRQETEKLIGFFVNMLVLRTNLAGNPTFREALARVREVVLGAYAHQELPFEQLIKDLHPERDYSAKSIVQAVFATQPYLGVLQSDTGTSFSFEEQDSGQVQFDLEIHLTETPHGLKCTFKYGTDKFEPAAIKRMQGHYQQLLEGFVARPEARIGEVAMLTEAEYQRLVVDWNETRTPLLEARTVQQLFEAQAERTPESIAIVFGSHQVTYGDLNRRANQLAHTLRQLGVGPEVCVGVCMERGIDLLLSLLAILKAGGAYVPLDPGYPQDRLLFMLTDARVPILLTLPSTPALLAYQGRRLDLLAEQARLACQPQDNPPGLNSEEHLAYVMYTSGSTGQPKGIGIPHRAITRLVCYPNYTYVGPGDRLAQAATATFDAATFEIWAALVCGATLVGLPREILLAPRDLQAFVRREQIHLLFVTTALFHQIARQEPQALASLRQVLFGGEAVDARLVQALLQAGPPQQLVHVYGPTETTTFASWYPVNQFNEPAASIPIGAPLSNTQLYVLNEWLQPQPQEVVGELYIGGSGLARGYLNQPERTAEKFVPHPWSPLPGARLYKTGDLVRVRGDGALEFLGRVDHQVKLRGYRIELGEIEAVLNQHPAVQEAVVILREDTPGDKRLLAYFVVVQRMVLNPSDLQDFLLEKLPDYMIPTAWIPMGKLPLTPNGKIDRRALPDPDPSRPELESLYHAPSTSIEKALVAIWTEVLKLDQVGIHDNFFKLGGHSLLATQVITRIRTTFQIQLPLRALFETPTVAELSRVIERMKKDGEEVQEVAIKPHPRAGQSHLAS
ncbi:MAG TPA: amino acid adenylation domain-containing protein [Ktedonobacteraceae bacterium]|nr:amino acid adenylation domain-containing protein [Ktedonobacteraceae bacterium]